MYMGLMDLKKQDREVNITAGTVSREMASWTRLPLQSHWAVVRIVSHSWGGSDSYEYLHFIQQETRGPERLGALPWIKIEMVVGSGQPPDCHPGLFSLLLYGTISGYGTKYTHSNKSSNCFLLYTACHPRQLVKAWRPDCFPDEGLEI